MNESHGFWATLNEFFTWLGTEPGKAALAGAAGGMMRWITLRSDWREGAAALVGGTICGVYLGPLALSILQPFLSPLLPFTSLTALAGFAAGAGGIGLTGFIIDVLARFTESKGDRNGPE